MKENPETEKKHISSLAMCHSSNVGVSDDIVYVIETCKKQQVKRG